MCLCISAAKRLLLKRSYKINILNFPFKFIHSICLQHVCFPGGSQGNLLYSLPHLPVVFWIPCDDMGVDYGLHNTAWFIHRIILRDETTENSQLTKRQPKVQCIFFHE